jgi:hypothetical protein
MKGITRAVMVIYVTVGTSALLRLGYVWAMYYLFGIKI